MNETEQRLRRTIITALNLDCDPDTIPNEGLRNTLGIDSVAAVELLIQVEQEFDIQIDDGDLNLELVDSIDTLTSYVDARVGAVHEGA
ncbi:acyl carrier protein [Dactylosporangium sp. NPDC049140]|uniref:acyl carrier protein n=1 Tax=Dactylosporangium sp. NPDC049140 TaxID=3155647 RepID=UPI0033DF0273